MNQTTFTKNDLARTLAAEHEITLTKAAQLAEVVLDAIHAALIGGQRVEFRNFGVFKVVTRKARLGRNPRNAAGGSFTIPAKRAVKFVASARLSSALN